MQRHSRRNAADAASDDSDIQLMQTYSGKDPSTFRQPERFLLVSQMLSV
jgi:hypothetical protein